MIVRNKKNGTNILAYGNTKVIIRAGETVDIPGLIDLNEVINIHDFKNRGWFEIIESKKSIKINVVSEETNLEKAKKEVKEYAAEKNKEIN